MEGRHPFSKVIEAARSAVSVTYWPNDGGERGALGVVGSCLPVRYASGANCVRSSTSAPVELIVRQSQSGRSGLTAIPTS